MKYLIYLLLFFSICSCGDSQNKYVDIPRTRVSTILPEGAKLLKYQTGWVKGDDLSIMVLEMPDKDYYTEVTNFNKNAFTPRGLTVLKEFETKIDNYSGKIILTNSGVPQLNSMMLMFGDKSFVVTVICNHKSNDKTIENEALEILQSIKFKKDKKVNPFENTIFTVDTVSNSFRFKAFYASSYIFQPNNIEKQNEKPIITLGVVDFKPTMTLESVLQTMTTHFSNTNGITGFVQDSVHNYKIGNANAIQSIGNFYSRGTKRYILFFVIAQQDLCISLTGFCNFDNEKMKFDIKTFCNNLKLRQ